MNKSDQMENSESLAHSSSRPMTSRDIEIDSAEAKPSIEINTCILNIEEARHSGGRITIQTPSSFLGCLNLDKNGEASVPLILISTSTTRSQNNDSVNTAETTWSQEIATIKARKQNILSCPRDEHMPQSLFLLSLAKLNENTLSSNGLNRLKTQIPGLVHKTSELSPPDSLTSAPPSYSFVMQQRAARRRPRLMGTFIPSPSFVQHAPPPHYGAAFDIYMDNPVQNAAPRNYNFGFTPALVICPECGYAGLTATSSKITLCTHLCAVILCLMCCWFCVPLPYILRSCKDVYHNCRNCRAFLGMYCPTNPENTYGSINRPATP